MTRPSQDALELFGDTPRGDWTLRDGRPGDLDAVLAVELAAQPAPWSRAIFERELDLEHSHLWVAPGVLPDDPAIAGFCVLWLVHDEAHVLNIAVHPGCRRRGLAREMLAELSERAVEHELAFITLEVRESNAAARALYGTLGFEEVGRRAGYYADTGEAAILLTWFVPDPEGG